MLMQENNEKDYPPINVIIRGEKAKFIAINKKLVYDKRDGIKSLLNENELMVLIGLYLLNGYRDETLIITPKEIYNQLTCMVYQESEKRLMKLIIEGLEGIINKGVVSVLNGLVSGDKIRMNSDIHLNVTKLLRKDKEAFIALDKREINRIMQCNRTADSSLSRPKLIALFVAIIDSISVHEVSVSFGTRYDYLSEYEGIVCFKSIMKLASIVGASTSSIQIYLDKLEAMKLIYIHRFEGHVFKNGKIKRLNNWYGRYQFKNEIKQLAVIKNKQLNFRQSEVCDEQIDNETKGLSRVIAHDRPRGLAIAPPYDRLNRPKPVF